MTQKQNYETFNLCTTTNALNITKFHTIYYELRYETKILLRVIVYPVETATNLSIFGDQWGHFLICSKKAKPGLSDPISCLCASIL